MVRKRKQSGLLATAMQGRWPVAAGISAGCLALSYLVLPLILGSNRMAVQLIGAFRAPLLIAAFAMGAIALIKYLREKTQTDPPATTSAPITPRFKPAAASVPPAQATASPAEPKPTEWSLALLQSIEWKRFEDLCAAYYREKGIRSATTPLGPDGGIDIRLFQGEDNRTTTIVQCKAWPENKVGVKLLRELLGVRVAEKAEKAFFMTCGGYTEDAIKFATDNGITLFTGEMLLMMLQRLPTEARQKLLAFATEGDYTTPTCPQCGLKLLVKQGPQKKFWGCRSYPDCRGKLGMRGV